MADYLGQEEKAMIDFVIGKIASHKAPSEILDQVGLVLDEDAENFVIKLWRALIFEILSNHKGEETKV